MKQISSIHNQLVKDIFQLQEKSKVRKKTQLFIIEGFREIEIALKNNYQVIQLLICFDLFEVEKLNHFKKRFTSSTEFIEITKEVYQKIAYRESTEGVIAVTQAKKHSIKDLNLPKS